MGWIVIKDSLGEYGVFPESSILGVFQTEGQKEAIFVVLGRNGQPTDINGVQIEYFHGFEQAVARIVDHCHPDERKGLFDIAKDAREGKEPCEECHLQDGEKCDVCGAQAKPKHGDECISGYAEPREPDGFPAPTGDGSRDLERIEAHMKAEASTRPTYREMTGIDLRFRANAGDEDAMAELTRRANNSVHV